MSKMIHKTLILVNTFVGEMIGLGQTVVLLIGKSKFSIELSVIIVSFIASFESVNAIKCVNAKLDN